MTTDITALREQLDTQQRSIRYNPSKRVFRLVLSFSWGAFKHVVVDVILLVLVFLWLRRKRIRRNELNTAPHSEVGRIEGAIRLLIGNAMAQMRKVGQGKQAHAGHILASSD